MHTYALGNAWIEIGIIEQQRQALLHEISKSNITVSKQMYPYIEEILQLDSEIAKYMVDKSDNNDISPLKAQHARSEYIKFGNSD